MPRTPQHTLAWLAGAVLACLLVFAVNRGPLYYFDSADYLNRGAQVLAKLGVAPAQEIAAVGDHGEADAGPGPEAAPAAATPASAEAPGKTADVSRSLVYALLLGTLAAPRALELAVLLNAAAATLAVWLPIRVLLRERLADPAGRLDAGLATFAAIAASLIGSLSFYVAFLMPDIFTAVLLLIAATLTAFAPRMTRGELAFCLALGAFAVMSHTSHLPIAALLIPLVLAGSWLLGGPRRWLAPLLFAAIALAGFVQLQATQVAVAKVEQKRTAYLPFLTARLVQDGPGLAYLKAHCPDAAIPTCALYGALRRSNDPWRLTATHIIFERSDRLGSFRLMAERDQQAVAAGQVGFALAVLRDRPLAVTSAVLRNMLRQASMNGVAMTIPEEQVRARMADAPGLGFTTFAGRLLRDDSWLAPLTRVQDALYLGSLAVVIALCCWPGLPARARTFLLMIVAGIAVNALVCGGISQPAMRYGARVIWLLPACAAAGAVLILAGRTRATSPVRAAGSERRS